MEGRKGGLEVGGHTRSNAVTVKRLFLRQLLALSLCLLPHFARFLCRAETTTSLLVHLRTRSHAIDRHKEQFLRLDLPEKMIHVGEYRGEYLVLGHTEVGILVVGVGAFATMSQRAFREQRGLTCVNNPIKIQIKVV